MVMVSMKELHDETSQVIREAERRGFVIVTRHGKPVAIIRPFSREELEDFLLLHHPEFRKGLEEAIAEYEAGEIRPLEEISPG